MAILRSKEISEMGSEELDSHLSELRMDLMKINGILASGGIPEDVGKAREIKRTIARILTYKQILSQKPKKAAEVKEKQVKEVVVQEKAPEAKKPAKASESKEKPKEPKQKIADTKKKALKDKLKKVPKKKR